MNLLETIVNAQHGAPLRALAQRFHISDAQACDALEALLPSLSTGLKQDVATSEGLERLLTSLERDHDARFLEEPVTVERDEAEQEGAGIVDRLLSGPDAARQAADEAARRSKMEPDLLRRMLPIVAVMAMGALAKQAEQCGIQQLRRERRDYKDLLARLGPLLEPGPLNATPTGDGAPANC